MAVLWNVDCVLMEFAMANKHVAGNCKGKEKCL